MFSRVCFILTLQNNRMYNMNVECLMLVYLPLTDLHVWVHSPFFPLSFLCFVLFWSVLRYLWQWRNSFCRMECICLVFRFVCARVCYIAIIFDFNKHITCNGISNCANIFNIFPCTRKSTDEEHFSICNFQ